MVSTLWGPIRSRLLTTEGSPPTAPQNRTMPHKYIHIYYIYLHIYIHIYNKINKLYVSLLMFLRRVYVCVYKHMSCIWCYLSSVKCQKRSRNDHSRGIWSIYQYNAFCCMCSPILLHTNTNRIEFILCISYYVHIGYYKGRYILAVAIKHWHIMALCTLKDIRTSGITKMVSKYI